MSRWGLGSEVWTAADLRPDPPDGAEVGRHDRRDAVRCSVATSPTAGWVAQQLRETFPCDSAPRFMIFDRDDIFSARLTGTIRSMLREPTRTSYQSPWKNGVAERCVKTDRQELLDHVIFLNRRHLRLRIKRKLVQRRRWGWSFGRSWMGVVGRQRRELDLVAGDLREAPPGPGGLGLLDPLS